MNTRAAGNLLAMLAEIPDPRGRKGRRHPLAAMLAATICAFLTGARGYKAIAQWVRLQQPETWHWLGFQRKPPCATTFRELYLVLPPEVLEEVLARWVVELIGQPEEGDLQAAALDGKTLCKTLEVHGRSMHLLSLLDHRTSIVLAQTEMDRSTNEHKAALTFLKTMVLQGRLITADAMFCQRDLCRQITDSGGDYLIDVKDNQQTLKAAIEDEFRPGFSPLHRAKTPAASL